MLEILLATLVALIIVSQIFGVLSYFLDRTVLTYEYITDKDSFKYLYTKKFTIISKIIFAPVVLGYFVGFLISPILYLYVLKFLFIKKGNDE